MNLKKYLKVWLRTTFLSLEEALATRGASVLFIIGKLLRFWFFVFSLFIILGNNREIAGFNLHQMITFFLVFSLFDNLAQLFFRGIYWFRQKVITGQLDLTLVKPVNPLFYSLTERTDFLDLPLVLIVISFLIKQNLNTPFLNLFLFFILGVTGMLIATAIHIIIASIGVITTEVDHAIWIYRDLSSLARVPVDIYLGGMRTFLTFIIPIALVYTIPAKALMGILSWPWAVFSLTGSLLFLALSLRFWNSALTQYTSASS